MSFARYTGPTTCAAPYSCVYSSDYVRTAYHYQDLPVDAFNSTVSAFEGFQGSPVGRRLIFLVTYNPCILAYEMRFSIPRKEGMNCIILDKVQDERPSCKHFTCCSVVIVHDEYCYRLT